MTPLRKTKSIEQLAIRRWSSATRMSIAIAPVLVSADINGGYLMYESTQGVFIRGKTLRHQDRS